MQPCVLAEGREAGHQTHEMEPFLRGLLKQPAELVFDRHDPAKIVAPRAVMAETQPEWRAKRHADRSFSASRSKRQRDLFARAVLLAPIGRSFPFVKEKTCRLALPELENRLRQREQFLELREVRSEPVVLSTEPSTDVCLLCLEGIQPSFSKQLGVTAIIGEDFGACAGGTDCAVIGRQFLLSLTPGRAVFPDFVYWTAGSFARHRHGRRFLGLNSMDCAACDGQ